MKFSAHWVVPGSKVGVAWERIGNAVLVSPFTARFEFENDHTVELDITVEGGVPGCEAIRIQRDPTRPSLTGAELRRLPLRDWVSMAVAHTAQTASAEHEGAWSSTEGQEAEKLRGEIEQRVARRTITDDFLRDVARVYRANREHNPRDAVAEQFTVALSTAARYVKLARERGFLGKALGPGQAGEQQ